MKFLYSGGCCLQLVLQVQRETVLAGVFRHEIFKRRKGTGNRLRYKFDEAARGEAERAGAFSSSFLSARIRQPG